MKRILILVAMISSCPALAADYAADREAVRVVQNLLEQDLATTSAGGKGVLPVPPGADPKTIIAGIEEWLSGRDADAANLLPQAKVDVFRVYYAATLLPKDTACLDAALPARCEQELMGAIERVKDLRAPYVAAYAAARGPLGLPPLSQVPKGTAASAALPVPPKQALALADQQCDDIGFSSGRQAIAEMCKRDNHRAYDELQAMRSDPEIRPDLWAACSKAVGFQVSTSFPGWSQCARFIRTSCAASGIRGDSDIQRCLRAIQNGGWILNSAAK
ncbi:hypothetical protein SAMD00023378_3925 [Ralstonia sp. NT80]|uniref:hypothetical protein n=1 Tax=Ralstonia sp. NT80 TaxID=1218247 RepID=UPI00076EE70D|nr:hypothetical protein [Ralstonia sp. NT80]GAQ30242.1 hypothetical protein SAMD00023378_3925 [Ralstonia sp. NT80]